MERFKKIKLYIVIILLFISSIFLISLGEQIDFFKVLSQSLIFIYKGLGDIFFTSHSLWVLLVIIFVIWNEYFIKSCKNLSEIFEEIGILKFKNGPKPEEKFNNVHKINEAIQNSPENNEPIRRNVIFYKKLLTKNGATTVCRFLLYAIDRPGRPKKFTLNQLFEWTFQVPIKETPAYQNTLKGLSYSAATLVQTGALEGEFIIHDQNTIDFSVRVSSSAHQALEELIREGYQMTPQLELD